MEHGEDTDLGVEVRGDLEVEHALAKKERPFSQELSGGGGDGGATGAEDRRAWLEMYLSKKSDKVDPLEIKRALWSRCNISGEPLRLPIVCDALGSLYNKEAVLKALVEKNMPQRLSYMTSLKDIKELKFDIDANKTEVVGAASNEVESGKFRCPITLQEFGDPRGRVAALRSTGYVFSERALKVCRSACEEHVSACEGGKECKITEEEIITLNGTDEERDVLRQRMDTLKVGYFQYAVVRACLRLCSHSCVLWYRKLRGQRRQQRRRRRRELQEMKVKVV